MSIYFYSIYNHTKHYLNKRNECCYGPRGNIITFSMARIYLITLTNMYTLEGEQKESKYM